eukprot:CAMPEP_0178401580 /NCGR_PEP_ID=MMETSP0689_2-20121128/16376_1 /TAXON_ID=160604 /ORGANISM="Amphidinium massartii, Strain CS-259" /LENGTH=86 /DNA_ID=CAMNT_0020022407 /DNA_START=27 /DNA_END=284 /DNA_ORIENTATION=+
MSKAAMLIIKTLLCVLASVSWAQQAGTMGDGNPQMTLKTCTLAGGCTSKQVDLVLDANWRWIHSSGTNCYTGNQWNNGLCPNNADC